ncbi:MAG: DUF2341 domain-containing protein [Candidatus Bathyarchaeia archaeon]
MKNYEHYKKAVGYSLINLLLMSMFTIAVLPILIRSCGSVYWWNLNWNFRKVVTIHHVNDTLLDFPILIDVTDVDLKNKAQPDIDDVVFIGNDGSKLAHEIEYYDSSTGRLIAWVKIPYLSSSEDTIIYMYYGNPESVDQQNKTAVWDSNFIMIQHFEETSGTLLDSTGYGNNANLYGTLTKTFGKIGSADSFNGSGYLRVPEGFLPTSAITVELWIKPYSYSTTTWTKYINTGPTTTRGITGGQTSLSSDRWALTLTWDNGAKSISTGGRPSGYNWIHLAVTWNGSYACAYFNGVKVREAAVTGTPDWIGKALYLASNYYGGERFNGTIDEVRISNIARSEAWIKTCYNNQQNPTTLYTIGEEEINPYLPSPLLVFENPPNQATDVYTNPTLSVKVISLNQHNMTIFFKEKISNTWVNIGIYENVPNGTYSVNAAQMTKLGTTYYWSVYVTDGITYTSKTYSLTTTTKILQQKWVATNVPRGASGVLIADINNDEIEEVLHAGIGGVVALNGTDGSVIWYVPDNHVGSMAQPQMADLDKDGILEIIVPLEGNSRVSGSTAGLLVLHANNGSLYWRKEDLGLETYSSPVICDIDGDGYPEIFFASTDIYRGLNGMGRITMLSYNGTILHQAFAWRPCGGGLSIADTDGDGEFELYMGDRHIYMNDPEHGDNDYGKGVQSYWAKNLTLRWYRPEILCSSQIPMIADVNKDGILDIIIGDLTGGVLVLNATDGSTIKMYQGSLGVTPTHYQPSIYDIDGDGNLEMLMADPHEDTLDPVSGYPSDDVVIWDLVNWKVDARIYIGKCYYGPQLADVTGDGKMEIIVCNYRGVFIFDHEGRVLDGIAGLAGTLNYAVAQDIDGDGYTELVVSSQSGRIYAFDTPARRPNPRPRTEVQFYSEYRRGAAEYVPLLTSQNPIIFHINPPDQATNVPLTLSQIKFTLVDYQKDTITYVIETNPNIGSGSGIVVGHGKCALNISGLEPDTTYTWTLKVTDGTNWTNKTFTFTTELLQPWWNTEWQYRKKITINRNKIVSNLNNFPVLIDITDSDLAAKAQTNGNDIVFTDTHANKLPHEIESYNPSIGRLIAWVNVPQLSPIEDTVLYMYYGNPNAENQQKPVNVWDSNFVMVQHFEETSGTRKDSTANGNNATPYGTVTKTSGKIGPADSFNSNGYLRIPEGFLPTSAITVELWIKPYSYSTTTWTKYINTGPTTTRGITGGQTSLSSDRWALTLTWDCGTKSLSTGGRPSDYNWIYLAVTWNGSYATAYYNGLKVNEAAVTGTPDWIGKALYLASNHQGGERFNGAIDEVRISNIARSEAWIKTCYNNQQNPTTLYTIGEEEKVSQLFLIYSPYPPDKATEVSPSITQLSFSISSSQGNLNYTVSTIPDIGSGLGLNVPSGRYSINVSGLQYATTYKWTVTITNGIHQTSRTFTFTTLPSEPPTHDDPILIKSSGNIICHNQSTTDPDGDKVTNIYNWYRNDVSITNLLLPFDTNSSTTVKDYSGYNNHGTIIRDVKWTPNGIIGGAYNFNRGYIQIPGTSTLDGGGAWSEITVEVWIKLSAYPPSGTSTRIIARIPSYEIGITSGKQLFASIWTATGNPKISGHNMITTTTTLNLNTWYHIVLTYKKGSGMTLYVNGEEVARKTPSESVTLNYNIQPSGPNPLYIGWFDYFKGTIDEIRIYPRSLTPQQIQQRYNETKDGQTNSSTIVAEELKTGEKWYCKITPNDSHQDGTTKTSNTVTIGQNDKPIAKNLKITPTTPKTTDDLTATYTYFDPDGDPESGTQIYWYRNGQLVPELNNSLIVPSSYTTKGETWYFTVKPSDGTEYGETQTSPSVTITNSPPKIDSYFPETDPTINEGESQMFNITYSDNDNDPITIQWYLNGTLVSTNDNYTFEANYTSAGTYNVKVVISDGQDEDSHEWTLTVLDVNAPPEITSWYPQNDPEPITLGQSQEFNITYYDPDNDPVTIQWYINDTLKGEWTGYTSILFVPEQAGTYIIKVAVSDQQSSDTHSWTLIVQENP